MCDVAGAIYAHRASISPRFELHDGDKLRLLLTAEMRVISADNQMRDEPVAIALLVDITTASVEPKPDAAYALLARSENRVSCPLFAWAPKPDRVDLVNPNDLLTGTVRRRAVFNWQTSVRSGAKIDFAIQKIAANGATHIPFL
jgi:hypothetical protein